MKIEEYLKTLPENLLSGQDAELSEKSLREIFKFANIGADDIFYHLGCSSERGIKIAVDEFKVKKAIGIDNDSRKIKSAKENLAENSQTQLICQDITESDILDASIILFWFADEDIINKMQEKFKKLKPETQIVTIWGPLPNCLPDKVEFPYIINKVPLKKTQNMQEQLLAVFGVKCIDFVTAWEFAERYTKSIGSEIKNDRFLTIIQTLIIWTNAKNLGVACGDKIPESIQTYINIMKMHFDIEFEHLLE